MSDPAKYRTKDEVAEYKEIDPLEVVKRTILSKKYMTQEQLDTMEVEVEQEVADSAEFAENSPFPDISELYTDVYQTDYPFIVE